MTATKALPSLYVSAEGTGFILSGILAMPVCNEYVCPHPIYHGRYGIDALSGLHASLGRKAVLYLLALPPTLSFLLSTLLYLPALCYFDKWSPRLFIIVPLLTMGMMC